MKALLIDHDDSFTYNLRNWLSPAFSVEVRSHRDLEVANKSLHDPATLSSFQLIVLSPGPKSPKDYPHVKKFLQNLNANQKVFGVCLGMQILTDCEGGSVQPYSPPLHGKKSKLATSDPRLSEFNGLNVARYHSLKCGFAKDSGFDVIAVSENDHLPMWVQHRRCAWLGFQFHPESFLTEKPGLFLGFLKNWCGQ